MPDASGVRCDRRGRTVYFLLPLLVHRSEPLKRVCCPLWRLCAHLEAMQPHPRGCPQLPPHLAAASLSGRRPLLAAVHETAHLPHFLLLHAENSHPSRNHANFTAMTWVSMHTCAQKWMRAGSGAHRLHGDYALPPQTRSLAASKPCMHNASRLSRSPCKLAASVTPLPWLGGPAAGLNLLHRFCLNTAILTLAGSLPQA